MHGATVGPYHLHSLVYRSECGDGVVVVCALSDLLDLHIVFTADSYVLRIYVCVHMWDVRQLNKRENG